MLELFFFFFSRIAASSSLFDILQIHVAPEHHGSLIGRGAEAVRRLMQMHEVNISIPQQDKNSDEVTVTGTAENVEAAVKDILKRVEELEEAAEDRVS